MEFRGIIISRLVWTSTHIGVCWVEPPSTEHVLEYFSIFFHFWINLSNFCAIGHWTHQPKGYQHSLNLRSKEALLKKHRKRMSDSFLQKIWKNNFIPLFSSSPISSSFLVFLKWLKILWVHQLGLYKISLYRRDKDVRFKILICFNSHIIEYWIPYIKHLICFLSRIEQFLLHQ